MAVPSMRRFCLMCLLLAGWGVAGCQTPPPLGGFETMEEVIEREQESRMIHRRVNIDIKGGGFFPIDSDFDPGPLIGFKGQIEGYKNLYFGIEYNFITQDIGDTVEDFLRDFQNGDPTAERKALSADPEQWFESLDRHEILFGFDYDIPFDRGPFVPRFRFGAGIGAVIFDGDLISDDAFGPELDDRTFVGFLFRPSAGFRFPVHENVVLFLEGSFDLIPPLDVTVNLDRNRTRLTDKVNFMGGSIAAGISITW